jgi:hypothetical protein
MAPEIPMGTVDISEDPKDLLVRNLKGLGPTKFIMLCPPEEPLTSCWSSNG